MKSGNVLMCIGLRVTERVSEISDVLGMLQLVTIVA
jgi:hypothetical protein